MKVENIIYIYLSISMSLIVYNIGSALFFRYTSMSNLKKMQKYRELINEELKRISEARPPGQENFDYLKKKLVHISEMQAFDIVLDELDENNTPFLREFLKNVSDLIIDLIPAYSKKHDVERMTFFLYGLRRHHLLGNSPSTLILDQMELITRHDNLYVRENALQAIYSSGDAERVARVFRYMDRNEIKHNRRLLSEGLISFAGDKDLLIREFLNYFDRFSEIYRVTILNYMRHASGDYKEEVLSILVDEKQDKEVRYSAIRYFGEHYHAEAEPVLVMLSSPEQKMHWEYRAIASKALRIYKSKAVLEVLKKNMTDPSWFVRYNASGSLAAQGYSYVNMADVFDSEDKYAIEMLQYRLDQRENREEG